MDSSQVRAAVPSLSTVVAAVLALAASGCCSTEPDPWSVEVSEVLADESLAEVRASATDPDEQCRSACVRLGDSERYFNSEDVTSCEAVPVEMNAGDPEDPWDPVYTELVITCTAEGEEIPFCTGRRPLGHIPALTEVSGVGSWFAIHAHLEQAAVDAFEQLAVWLERRGAPSRLVDGCRLAKQDEIVHAGLMQDRARRHGAEVPAVNCEPCPEELFDVALHNAVEGCVSEAFAALVAAYQARHVSDPQLRATFSRLADDELRHGQLAWDIDAWFRIQLSGTQLLAVESARHVAFQRLPDLARRAAEATPAVLGWPAPELAYTMARQFADMMLGVRAAA